VNRALRAELNSQLREYVQQRGSAILGRRKHMQEVAGAEAWEEGLQRMIWLCTGISGSLSVSVKDDLPTDFPFAAVARTIAGTLALFSQIGLQMAMILAQLYNVYRRDSFSEIILSGGVLSGATGNIVESQTKKFLLKYFDKIYGPGKTLADGSIVRAVSGEISNPGMFGAAMAANRMAQIREAREFVNVVRDTVAQADPGAIVSTHQLTGDIHSRQFHLLAEAIFDEAAVQGKAIRMGPGRIRKAIAADFSE
jgi:hypothetical protein